MIDTDIARTADATIAKPAGKTSSRGQPGKTPARRTKRQDLIRLLSTKAGADIARMCDQLGWQSHSVRAALTGLRKEGLDIQKNAATAGKPTRYSIASGRPTATEPDAGSDT